MYRRVLLGLSGTSLGQGGFDFSRAGQIASEVAQAAHTTQLAVVIGGGNLWRGRRDGGAMDRVIADQVGMLATAMNALVLGDLLGRHGVSVTVFQAPGVTSFGERYTPMAARRALDQGQTVVLGGGNGAPFFTTDTTAALRGLELNVELVLKATNVDGVYDRDPRTGPATKFDRLSYRQLLALGLGVIDAAAAALLERELPLIVFDMFKPGNLSKVLSGQPVGTWVS
ncbi:MAG: UMP kinase [Deinococcus sp.]|nr:UMP kinase [Deinococcus sp.]